MQLHNAATACVTGAPCAIIAHMIHTTPSQAGVKLPENECMHNPMARNTHGRETLMTQLLRQVPTTDALPPLSGNPCTAHPLRAILGTSCPKEASQLPPLPNAHTTHTRTSLSWKTKSRFPSRSQTQGTSMKKPMYAPNCCGCIPIPMACAATHKNRKTSPLRDASAHRIKIFQNTFHYEVEKSCKKWIT